MAASVTQLHTRRVLPVMRHVLNLQKNPSQKVSDIRWWRLLSMTAAHRKSPQSRRRSTRMYTDPAHTKFALAVGGLARARPGLALAQPT